MYCLFMAEISLHSLQQCFAVYCIAAQKQCEQILATIKREMYVLKIHLCERSIWLKKRVRIVQRQKSKCFSLVCEKNEPQPNATICFQIMAILRGTAVQLMLPKDCNKRNPYDICLPLPKVWYLLSFQQQLNPTYDPLGCKCT